ncbi:hypothetical protein Nepgr_006091 [Nepenthes gracilis]|uniref:C2H2-type domain-containing protein n=1 Tax=Nepenthes gracilis TaxID=150966 RepID=A0AAD3S4C8_NEPGR|nr:hypothetical protein Nepgr_006091 [Nepenthes gracilis]
MEEGKCMTWVKRKRITETKSSESWEEKAFSEAAEGRGLWIWPPRSYSCSFCKREFSSAQALGGHMNVHRRDRALLKQIPPIESHHHPHLPHHHKDQYHQERLIKSLAAPYSNHYNPAAAAKRLPPRVPNEGADSELGRKDDDAQTKLSVGLHFELAGDRPKAAAAFGGDDAFSSKRRKIGCGRVSSLMPLLFPKSYGDEIFSSTEELDLELRLGDAPKIN